jgi:hypothetical protein
MLLIQVSIPLSDVLYLVGDNEEQRLFTIGKHRQYSSGADGLGTAPLPYSSFAGSFSSCARDASGTKPIWAKMILVYRYRLSYPEESAFLFPSTRSLNTTTFGAWDSSSRTYAAVRRIRSPDSRPTIDAMIDPGSVVSGDIDLAAFDLASANAAFSLATFVTASFGWQRQTKNFATGLGLGWHPNFDLFGPSFQSGRGLDGTFGDGSSSSTSLPPSSWAKDYDDANTVRSSPGGALFQLQLERFEWKKIVEFPCCTTLYVAILDAVLAKPLVVPSASPSRTPSNTPTSSVTPTATSTPPPFALAIQQAQGASPLDDGNYCVSGDGGNERLPCLSPLLPPTAFSVSARGCPSEEAWLRCTAAATTMSSGDGYSSSAAPPATTIVWPGWFDTRSSAGNNGSASTSTTTAGAGFKVRCNNPSEAMGKITVSSSPGSSSGSGAATMMGNDPSWIYASAVAPLPPLLMTAAPASPRPVSDVATSSAGDAATVTTTTITCSLETTNAEAARNGRGKAVGSITVPVIPYQWPYFKDLLLFFPIAGGILTSPSLGSNGNLAPGAAYYASLNLSSKAHSDAVGAFYASSSAPTSLFAAAGNANSTNATTSGNANALGTSLSSSWSTRCGGFSSQQQQQECLSEVSVRAFLYRAESKNFSTSAATTGVQKPFSATVSRAAYGVLVAERSASYSLDATTITIGGQPAPVLWVSSDGMLLHFQFPQQLCNKRSSASEGSRSADRDAGCRYQTLSINTTTNPTTRSPSSSNTNQRRALAGATGTSATIDSSFIAASTLSCPPFCPGAGPAALLLLVVLAA